MPAPSPLTCRVSVSASTNRRHAGILTPAALAALAPIIVIAAIGRLWVHDQHCCRISRRHTGQVLQPAWHGTIQLLNCAMKKKEKKECVICVRKAV